MEKTIGQKIRISQGQEEDAEVVQRDRARSRCSDLSERILNWRRSSGCQLALTLGFHMLGAQTQVAGVAESALFTTDERVPAQVGYAILSGPYPQRAVTSHNGARERPGAAQDEQPHGLRIVRIPSWAFAEIVVLIVSSFSCPSLRRASQSRQVELVDRDRDFGRP